MKGDGSITKNQIEYNKLLETKRHQIADEDIRRTGNQQTFELGRGQLDETRRSNLERERQNRSTLLETQRHNTETENVQRLLYGENVRANQAREAISMSQIEETNRSNRASESLSAQRNQISAQQIAQNYDLGLRNAAETERSHVAGEINQQAMTEISQALAKLRVAELEEQSRHNMVSEKQGAVNTMIKGVDVVQSGFSSVMSSIARVIPLL